MSARVTLQASALHGTLLLVQVAHQLAFSPLTPVPSWAFSEVIQRLILREAKAAELCCNAQVQLEGNRVILLH